MPALTEAVRRLVDDDRKQAFSARGEKLAKLHMAMVDQSKTEKRAAEAGRRAMPTGPVPWAEAPLDGEPGKH